MFRKLFKCEKGEGMLEMILFIPLALLILFVGIDIGLSRLDTALVTDAVREGIHNQGLTSSDKIYKFIGGAVSVDQSLVESTAQHIADTISGAVTSKRLSLASSDGNNQIRVAVTPVVFDIDSRTGSVKSYQKGAEFLSQLGNPNLDIRVRASKATLVSEDEYLASQVQATESRGGFAIVKPTFGVTGGLSLDRFYDVGVAYIVSVDALSPSINPAWLQGELGSELGYQIKEFQVIRN